MRTTIILLGLLFITCLFTASGQPVDSSYPDPPNLHFYHKFHGDFSGYGDKLKLRTSELKIGKIQEWGHLVYFWDKVSGRKYTYKRDEVTGIEIIRSDDLKKKPNLPDLTVAYIERTPRDQGWHNAVKYEEEGKKGLGVLMIEPDDYQLHPKPGQEVTFTVHVLNAGLAQSKSCTYEVLMDDAVIDSGKVDSIKPGDEKPISVKWNWQEGQHYIKVLLDTENKNSEIAKWNNTFIDPVRALTFFFVIGSNTYNGFSDNLNIVDTFCYEDWVQYHVHGMNWLFVNSVWPTAPEGILERVRIDKIVVADNYGDEEVKKKWDRERRYENDPEGPIMFNGNWDFGDVADESDPEKYKEGQERIARWASRHDWGLPHELGHQLGLVDHYWTNHGMRDVLVRNKDGNYQNVMHFYPWPQMMMHWHGPHIFSELHAGYLNHTRGRPRGFFGDFYYQIPKKNVVSVYSNTGKPVEGVEINLYQRWMDLNNTFIEGDWKAPWAYGPDPIFTGKTGKDGKYIIPNQKVTPHDTPEPGYSLRDNPWGQINVVGDNVLLLAKINYGDIEAFHWLRLHDANIGYLRGYKDEFSFDIYTRIPDTVAPEPPQQLKAQFQRREHGAKMPMSLLWKPSFSPDIVEYRCYTRFSHGGQSVKPYRLINAVSPDKIRGEWYVAGAEYWEPLRKDQGYYSSDSYFGVTAVDSNGRESAFSNIVFIPSWSAHNVALQKVAIGPEGKVYISINANEIQLLTWDEKNGLREMGLRDANVPHDYPRFYGLAIDSKNRIIGTDASSGKVGMYDLKGDAIKVIGKKGKEDGEFDRPSDVAIDNKGRIYIADTGNQRIQVFDSELNFLFRFGGEGDDKFQFEEPVALGILDGKLAVTDRKPGKITVYDISGDAPQQLLEIAKVNWQTDRAYVAQSGNIYTTDPSGVIIYKPDGTNLRKIDHTSTGRVFQPRGLCPDGKGNAYFVNNIPYCTVMKIELK